MRENRAGDEVQRGGGALTRGHRRPGKDLDSVPCDRIHVTETPRVFQEKEAKIWCIF